MWIQMLEENMPGSPKQKGGGDGVWGQRANQGISEPVERQGAHRASASSEGHRIGASVTVMDRIPGRRPPRPHIPVDLIATFW